MLVLSLLFFFSSAFAFNKVKHRSETKEFYDRVLEEKQSLIRRPSILDYMTPTVRETVDAEYKDVNSRIIVGILIENYSKYSLVDPVTSKKFDCKNNEEIHAELPVAPGTSELFTVLANNHGVCGAISWQIVGPDGRAVTSKKDKRLGRRLVLTYEVTWR